MPLNASRELLAEPLEAGYPTAVDFSTARPTDAALDEVHAVACGRYVSYPGGSNKDLEPAEVDRYRSQGRAIFVYWEDQVGDALGGRAKGQEMARYAAGQVAARGGPADGGVIYFCVDFDATPAQIQGLVIDWFRGIRDVLPLSQVGVYAGYYPVKAVLDAGLAAYACQTRAWSGSLWDPRAQLQQYSWVTLSDGSQVDLLRVMAADYGQWDYEREDWFSMATQDDLKAALRGVLTELFPAAGGLTDVVARRVGPVIAQYGIARTVDVRAAVAPLLDDETALTQVVQEAVAGVPGGAGADVETVKTAVRAVFSDVRLSAPEPTA